MIKVNRPENVIRSTEHDNVSHRTGQFIKVYMIYKVKQ